MKKIVNIIFYFICCLILIFSLAMLFIEGRMLFFGDWLVSGNIFYGFIRSLFKVVLCLMFIFMIFIEFIKKLKNNEMIKKNLIYYNIGLFISTMILFIVSANYIGLISISLMFMFIILKIIKREMK